MRQIIKRVVQVEREKQCGSSTEQENREHRKTLQVDQTRPGVPKGTVANKKTDCSWFPLTY